MKNKGWLGIENKKIKYEKKNYFADKDWLMLLVSTLMKLITAELHLRQICNEVLCTKKLILLHKFKELVFKQV